VWEEQLQYRRGSSRKAGHVDLLVKDSIPQTLGSIVEESQLLVDSPGRDPVLKPRLTDSDGDKPHSKVKVVCVVGELASRSLGSPLRPGVHRQDS
jgi:hypothetical protein